jgi:protein SCO1/2
VAPCCWHENLAVHDSPIAAQLRAEVENLGARGESEEQIVDLFVSRYGERILTEPRGRSLWILTVTPIVVLLIGLSLLILRLRRVARPPASLVIAAFALFGLSACGASHRLNYFGPVPDFELISQTGRKITLADLRGKVWVADTFFTTCTGPCPMMSAKLHRVEQAVGKLANVRFVSFTVDPAHDTQQAMLEYSGHFHAAPDRWFFLTGKQPVLNHVALDGLKLSKVDGSLDHSTEFVLVDADTMIRGYYFPFEKDQFERLIADVRSLAGS